MRCCALVLAAGDAAFGVDYFDKWVAARLSCYGNHGNERRLMSVVSQLTLIDYGHGNFFFSSLKRAKKDQVYCLPSCGLIIATSCLSDLIVLTLCWIMITSGFQFYNSSGLAMHSLASKSQTIDTILPTSRSTTHPVVARLAPPVPTEINSRSMHKQFVWCPLNSFMYTLYTASALLSLLGCPRVTDAPSF